MENARQILEQGTDQNRADRAATLEDLEPAFAEHIDENNEAHHVRTVTDENVHAAAILTRDTEKHRAEMMKEQRLLEQEKTKQAIEKTRQIKSECEMKIKANREEQMGARTDLIQNGLSSRAVCKQKEAEARELTKQKEVEARELTKQKEVEATELTKRAQELTKQKVLDLKFLLAQQNKDQTVDVDAMLAEELGEAAPVAVTDIRATKRRGAPQKKGMTCKIAKK